jgi:dihydroorotate dehydrogenase
MLARLFSLAQPALMLLDTERAHELTLRALEAGLYPRCGRDDPRLAQTLWARFPTRSAWR